MSRIKPAGGLLDVVDVVDFAVLSHRLFPAVRQRTEVCRVRVVVVQLRGSSSLLVAGRRRSSSSRSV